MRAGPGRYAGCACQRGMSMVELLVCLPLALAVSLAAVAAISVSRASLNIQDENTRMVETAMLALSIIERAVRHAGYEEGGTPAAGPAILGLDDSTLNADSALLEKAASPGINNSDVLAVGYRGSGELNADGSISNCAGVALPSSQPGSHDGRGWSVFHIGRSPKAEPELRCKVQSRDGASWTSDALATGVEAMQVLYGVDQDGDGAAERYVPARTVAGMAAWSKVISVRVALLVRSSQSSARLPGNHVHHLFDEAYSRFHGASDKGARVDEASLPDAERQRLRRVFGLNIALRNAPVGTELPPAAKSGFTSTEAAAGGLATGGAATDGAPRSSGGGP